MFLVISFCRIPNKDSVRRHIIYNYRTGPFNRFLSNLTTRAILDIFTELLADFRLNEIFVIQY